MVKAKIWLTGLVAACAVAGTIGLAAQTARAQAETLGPVLQSVTPDSVWVVWETSTELVGRVRYGETPALGNQVTEPLPTRHHEVQLTGLTPATRYGYQVDDGAVASFRTAPEPGVGDFSFVVLGDTRSNPAVHVQIIDRIVAAAPDLALHTGDLVGDGLSEVEWDRFFSAEAPLLGTTPYYPALGNHERYDPGAQRDAYTNLFHLPGNELWYTFTYAAARFIVLKADGSYPSAAQMAWLRHVLTSNTSQWLFVALHTGPFTSVGQSALETGIRARLVPLFERYGVDAVFSGHDHGYERIVNNGITYIVTAGGAAPIYALTQPEPGSQASARAYHFVDLAVKGGYLRAKVIDVNGEVIDQFKLAAKRGNLADFRGCSPALQGCILPT